jgi:AraC-like DNA-binding protein
MSEPITQRHALPSSALGAGNRAHFFTARGFPGLDFLTASFRSHSYAFHAHETFTIGNIDAGVETWQVRGARHYAGPGWLALTNPLDVHDGAPYGEGYAYRMSYPTVELIRRIAGSVAGRRQTDTPMFKNPAIRDPVGARLFAGAHRALERGTDAMVGEEKLLRAYAFLLTRHAGIAPAALRRERGAVARVRDVVESGFAEPLRLGDLAKLAGFSTYHLIRAFRAEVGLTPHAYLVDVRVRRAQALLKAGEAPADVAALVGFSDQAHLTRAFKARLGVAPSAYRRAHRG